MALSPSASLTVIFVCVFFSAFFSAAETSITSLGTLKVKHLIASAKKKGRSLNQMKLWIKHPGRVLTTILMFSNIVNILASAVATDLAAHTFESGAIGIATGATTLLVLVFGEIIPKSFAKAYAERFAIFSMSIIVVVYYMGYPIVRLLSGFADSLIKLVSQGKLASPLITEEEIEFFVSEGEKAGVIKDIKKEIIEGAFDFDETKVREIITPRTDITAFSSDTPIDEILDIVIETGHSRFPVYKGHIDHVVGLLLAKDLLAVPMNKPDQKLLAKDVMREAVFAPESKTIMEVFKDLKRSKSHMAVIIDEYGGTAGVVTMEDILEEIVGEIQDEFDSEPAKIVEIEKNIFEVSGAMNIDEFIEYFCVGKADLMEHPEDQVDTVAGWVTQVLGQMPKTGQKIFVGPLKLEVLEVRRRRIELLRVEKRAKQDLLSKKEEVPPEPV